MKTGDLLAKMASGQTLSMGEIEELRRSGNNIQSITNNLSRSIDGAGNLVVPGAWSMLCDVRLAYPSANINLTSIPNTFRHLRLLARLRSDRAATGDSVGMQFNGDTGDNYYSMACQWTNDGAGGATLVSSERFADDFLSLGGAVGDTAPTSVFGVLDYTVIDYAGSAFKSICAHAGGTKTLLTKGQDVLLSSGTWASTSAIKSILLYPANGGTVWVAGSRATLYGMSD